MNNLFDNLNKTQRSLVVAIVAIVVYVVSTAATYSLFASSSTTVSITGKGGNQTAAVPTPGGIEQEDPKLPRTEVCPLDGDKHTKPAREKWEKRRPLAVMIENHVESRPQSGLSSADIVYEAVAEGGITRFMAVYYCNFGDIQVGPVRSIRTYFLDWAPSEINSLLAHVGGANTPGPADALGQISKYGVKSLNQFGIGFPTYWRDYQRLGHPVATEHTMYSSTDKLWAVAEKRGWGPKDEKGVSWDKNFVSWKFNDKGSTADKDPAATKIDVTFWQGQGDYSVTWNYDSTCNCYKRVNGGQPHTDLNTKQQISPMNVVVRFQRESAANDGYPGNVHRLYGNTGQGKALIFQNGKVIEGKWIKPTRLSREKFVNSTGKEIEFIPGQIWLETVPEGSDVKY